MKRHDCRAFTLVELLVVIAIIGVMVAMMIPAIQASREAARRNQCQGNLAQLSLALQSYENAYESLPAGVVNPDGPIRSEPVGLHQGWLIQLLPYLDEQNAYRLIDFSKSVYDPANAPVREHWPRNFICPSESLDVKGASNYAGCHHHLETPIDADNRGVLFLNSHIRRQDVTDGAAYTLFIGEKRNEEGDLGWMSGTRATLRNTGLPPNDPASPPSGRSAGCVKVFNTDEPIALIYVGGFASQHPGGIQVALGDASVRFVSDEIDLQVWRQLGDRADGKLLNLDSPD
jgi:prepilin-type N-terminal cleavage/methylation domain-containing protein